ncbi:MAG: hypothetical protein Q8R15_03215 [Candidatus Micrarchaeota archaeon]|nr:hypothetical protein [Candidatus Micrarchaeota archaeon]
MAIKSNLFEGLFSKRAYVDAEEAMHHALEIHQKMPGRVAASLDEIMDAGLLKAKKTTTQIQKSAIDPLSPFHRTLLRIAPDYFEGKKYDTPAIIAEAFENAPPETLKELRVKINSGITQLTQLKLLERLPRVLKIRETNEDEIARHRNLVSEVTVDSHTFLPRYWDKYLSDSEIQQAGQRGLTNALETKHPSETGFDQHAVSHIAASIAAEVRKKRSARVYVPREARKENIKLDLQKLLNLGAKPHWVMAFALMNLGRGSGEVARHLKVSQSDFYYAYQKATKLLKK